MKSKLLIGAICVAVSLSAASVASAEVFSGRIPSGKTRVYTVDTDASMILDIIATMFNERTDPDIMVTMKEGNDDVVLADSASAVLQLEKASIGVPGAAEITIMLINADGPLSRYSLLVTTPADTGALAGPALPVRYVGEFDANTPTTDPRLASLQQLVWERTARRH